MNANETLRLTQLCERHAEEEAEKDLRFAGERALQALPLAPAVRAELRAALLFYARQAAGRAVRMWRFHTENALEKCEDK